MNYLLSSVILSGAICLVPTALAAPSSTVQNSYSGGQSIEQFTQVTPTKLHYLKVGVNEFEKGNYDKAEFAFKAVLRADTDNVYAKQYLYVITELRKLQAK